MFEKLDGDWIKSIIEAVQKIIDENGVFHRKDLFNIIEWPGNAKKPRNSADYVIQSWAWNGKNKKNKLKHESFFTYMDSPGFWKINSSSRDEIINAIQESDIDVDALDELEICNELLKTNKLTPADKFFKDEKGDYIFLKYIFEIKGNLSKISKNSETIQQEINNIKLDEKEYTITSFERSAWVKKQSRAIWGYQCAIMCEMKQASFENNQGEMYVEVHHLLPMHAQKEYKNIINIDVKENVICLCPKHHREIHLGNKRRKIELITYIFHKLNDKSKWYAKNNISLNDIFKFY